MNLNISCPISYLEEQVVVKIALVKESKVPEICFPQREVGHVVDEAAGEAAPRPLLLLPAPGLRVRVRPVQRPAQLGPVQPRPGGRHPPGRLPHVRHGAGQSAPHRLVILDPEMKSYISQLLMLCIQTCKQCSLRTLGGRYYQMSTVREK